MPSLGIAPHPEGCTGPFTMPAPGVTSASGAMPTDGSLRRLEIGVQAVQLSPYHTGPADASVPAPGPDRRFSGMRLSRSPFGSGLAIGPKNLPSSSSRLRRGYDKAPRGAIKVEVIDESHLAAPLHVRMGCSLLAFRLPRAPRRRLLLSNADQHHLAVTTLAGRSAQQRLSHVGGGIFRPSFGG